MTYSRILLGGGVLIAFFLTSNLSHGQQASDPLENTVVVISFLSSEGRDTDTVLSSDSSKPIIGTLQSDKEGISRNNLWSLIPTKAGSRRYYIRNQSNQERVFLEAATTAEAQLNDSNESEDSVWLLEYDQGLYYLRNAKKNRWLNVSATYGGVRSISLREGSQRSPFILLIVYNKF